MQFWAWAWACWVAVSITAAEEEEGTGGALLLTCGLLGISTIVVDVAVLLFDVAGSGEERAVSVLRRLSDELKDTTLLLPVTDSSGENVLKGVDDDLLYDTPFKSGVRRSEEERPSSISESMLWSAI